MFLLFGSSMRKFDENSIRYKIENQVFDFCVFWGRSLATCLSRQFSLSLLAALFSCYLAPFCVFPCHSFLPSSFSFWTISLISYWSLLVAYLFRARLLLFVSPFLSSSSIRIFRSCKLSSPFFSPQFLSLLFPLIPQLMNFILQDIVEPKVLGDSLHLHPVFFSSCLLILFRSWSSAVSWSGRLFWGLSALCWRFRSLRAAKSRCITINIPTPRWEREREKRVMRRLWMRGWAAISAVCTFMTMRRRKRRLICGVFERTNKGKGLKKT